MRLVPRRPFVCDLHCDTALKLFRGEGTLARSRNQVDIVKMRRGGIGLQVFACCLEERVYPEGPLAEALRLLRTVARQIRQNRESIGIARNCTQVEALREHRRIAALLAVEGGHALEGKLENLERLYREGMRLLTLTWAFDNELGGASGSGTGQGLTPFGRSVVRDMNRRGILIDVSHASRETVSAVTSLSHAPVIASHSCVRALRVHHRNLTRDQIRALAGTGGVIGVSFYPAHLGRQRIPPSTASVADQVEYMASLAGIECVALGSDFDGIPSSPVDLRNAAHVPRILRELDRRGFRPDEIAKIAGLNFLRVFRQVCG